MSARVVCDKFIEQEASSIEFAHNSVEDLEMVSSYLKKMVGFVSSWRAY